MFEQEAVVDLAGARFVAPWIVGQLDMVDVWQVRLHRARQITFHDLHVVDVVLQEQVGAAHFVLNRQRLRRVVQVEARNVAGVDSFHHQLDAHRLQFVSGVFEVGDESFFDHGLVNALWANTRQAVDLVVAQHLRVSDGQVDTGTELFNTVRQAGDPALPFGPITGWQIEQHLGQFVGIELRLDIGRAVVVRKQVFNAVETSVGSRLKTDKKILFGEQHGQVGGKTRHGELQLLSPLPVGEGQDD